MEVDHSKTTTMRSWPKPRTLTELRGFVRLTGYYRKFVQHYGTITKPLTDMTKRLQFKWSEEGELTFQKLKKVMMSTPVLALPDFEISFKVHTDASDVGIGVILVQKGCTLEILSKALGIKKVEWSVSVKEMMVVVEAMRIWLPYLMERKFYIITDQQPLKHLLKKWIATPKL